MPLSRVRESGGRPANPSNAGLGPAYARAAAGQAAGLEAGPPEPALAAAYPTAGVRRTWGENVRTFVQRH